MAQPVKSDENFDLQTLDVLLDAVADQAVGENVDRKDFYQSTNQRVLAGTHSLASLIWVSNGQGQLRIVGQEGWDSISETNQNKLKQLVRKFILTADERGRQIDDLPFAVAYTARCRPKNGFHFVFLLVRSPGDAPAFRQLFGDLVAEITTQIEIFENTRSANQPHAQAYDMAQVAQLVQNIGQSSGLKQMSYLLVNDLAKISGADRVSYLSNSGKIQAISGAATISYKSAEVRTLTRLGKSVLAMRSAVEWNQDGIQFDGPRLPKNLTRLKEELKSSQGYAVACLHQGRLHGAVVMEYFQPGEDSAERRQLINQVVEFASPVIARSNRYHSIPGIGALEFFYNHLFGKSIRLAVWAAILTTIIYFTWYFLFAVPQPFEIYGEGVLEPVRKQHVFAQTDGEIKKLLVAEKSAVETGQLLLALESATLEKELIEVEGEIAEVQQQLRNLALTEIDENVDDVLAEEAKRASEVERLKIRLTALEARLSFFEQRRAKQEVVAPLGGTITTPDLRRRLVDRPVNRGDLLMSIAQTDGQWQIKLEIPDNRIQFIERASEESQNPLTVEFRLKSDSSQTWQGQLQSLDYRSHGQPHETATVTAVISVDEAAVGDALRLGTRVFGKINCGQRSNYFLLTYEIQNRIREWLFW